VRIKQISLTNLPPISRFEVDNLSDVVVIAGRNGVGKTNLLQGLVSYFQQPTSYTNIRLTIEATDKTERDRWGKSALNTADSAVGAFGLARTT
jgi:predicted ATP-binding protein involved in virulence